MGLRISSTHPEGEDHGHFVRRRRSRQERLCSARGERGGQTRAGAPERASRSAARADRCAAAVHDRHGGVFRRAPLGATVHGPRPHGAPDGPEVRRALPAVGQARQERCGRRRRELPRQ